MRKHENKSWWIGGGDMLLIVVFAVCFFESNCLDLFDIYT